MTQTSIVDLKKHLSGYLALAERGEDIVVLKRNIPVAHIVGIPGTIENHTKLGFARESMVIKGDPTEPFMPESESSRKPTHYHRHSIRTLPTG